MESAGVSICRPACCFGLELTSCAGSWCLIFTLVQVGLIFQMRVVSEFGFVASAGRVPVRAPASGRKVFPQCENNLLPVQEVCVLCCLLLPQRSGLLGSLSGVALAVFSPSVRGVHWPFVLCFSAVLACFFSTFCGFGSLRVEFSLKLFCVSRDTPM